MKDLIEKIKDRQVILFVGAGVSASLGLPTWSQLMDYVAESLNIDSNIFKLYGDNLTLTEYYSLKSGSIGPLRSWMDKNLNVSSEVIENSEVLSHICGLKFPIIYTTNYDNCLERAHQNYGIKYHKITKVEDLCDMDIDSTQIVKFHGDFEDDESIVLTESSFFKRMDFESPLDIKLRSDSLGKSVLFIGYSLSDINIRYLIYKLNHIWEKSNKQSQRPKSYMFLGVPNPIQETILESHGIKPIVGEEIDPTVNLENFLKVLCDGCKKA
jgi:hypothetical protein